MAYQIEDHTIKPKRKKKGICLNKIFHLKKKLLKMNILTEYKDSKVSVSQQKYSRKISPITLPGHGSMDSTLRVIFRHTKIENYLDMLRKEPKGRSAQEFVSFMNLINTEGPVCTRHCPSG